MASLSSGREESSGADSSVSELSQDKSSTNQVQELLPNGVILSSDLTSEIKSKNINAVFFEKYDASDNPLQSMYRDFPKVNGGGEGIGEGGDDGVSSSRRSSGKKTGWIIAMIVVCVAAIGVTLGVVLPNDSSRSPSTTSAGEADTGGNVVDDVDDTEVSDADVTNADNGTSIDDGPASTPAPGPSLDCQYEDNIFTKTVTGRLYVTIAGVDNMLTDEEAILYASKFQESFNTVAGCDELYQRHLENVTLTNSNVVSSDTGNSKYIETELLSSLSYMCYEEDPPICPDSDEPFFSVIDSTPSKRKLATNKRKTRVRGFRKTFQSGRAVNVNTLALEFESQIQTSIWTSTNVKVIKIASGTSEKLLFDIPRQPGWTDKLSNSQEFRIITNP